MKHLLSAVAYVADVSITSGVPVGLPPVARLPLHPRLQALGGGGGGPGPGAQGAIAGAGVGQAPKRAQPSGQD